MPIPCQSHFYLPGVALASWQIIKDHQMGLFDDHIGKNRCRRTFGEVQFLKQIGFYVFCPMGHGEDEVLGNSRVEPLPFRHPKPGFRHRTGRNFSEKLKMVRVQLLKYGHRASRPGEVDALGWRVKVDGVVGATHAVERLHNLSRLRIHYYQLSRFILMSTSNFASVWFDPAAHEQAMMDRVQTRGMRNGTASDWPLGDDSAFLQIDDRDVALTFYNIPHSDIQSFTGWFEGYASRITAGQLNAVQ